MVKKRIILAMPKHNDIFAEIIKNLEYYQFDVTFVDSNPKYIKNFRYKNVLDRIFHLVRKIFFRDYSYKHLLKEKLLVDNTKMYLSSKQYDYALIIRPDTYPLKLLQLIKTRVTKSMIGYQWDGLTRFPAVLETIDLFDSFYVFDSNDIQNNDFKKFHLSGITNFYFDVNKPAPISHTGKIAYFVGSHIDERISAIDSCAFELNKNNIQLKFIIPTDDPWKISKYKQKNLITFGAKNKLSFHENISNINYSDILVDIVNPIHHGLSFRVFEAIYYQKKLITTNPFVQYYDFFHPNNIMIWEKQNYNFLSEFLAKPMVVIDSEIIQKYSFGNWIKNILNLDSYQKITLPQ